MGLLVDVLGESPRLAALRRTVERLLSGRADHARLPPVLIRGETGTGKGLLARSIHRESVRGERPFVDVNCAAIPETMLEAELFGFERGAFTDARHAKLGLFQAAHRGVIFLDEIGLLSLGLQAKLLKVLEEKTVRRLGSTRSEPADAWVISATNEDLEVAICERRFREDLYHRLAVITLTIPPLRERGEDVLLLAEAFLARTCHDYGLPLARLGDDARAALTAHTWPGNVRELSNVIERAAVLAGATVLTPAHLGLPTPGGPAMTVSRAPTSDRPSTRETKRQGLEQALAETNWNISRTAARLGLTRNTVRARIKQFALSPPRTGPVHEVSDAVQETEARASRPERAPISGGQPIDPGSMRWGRRRIAMLRVARRQAPQTTELEWSEPLKAIIAKVQSFGGVMEDFGGDGSVASFGVEPLDDPSQRAAHAALAIRREWSKIFESALSPSGQIAIHTCEISVVYAGDTCRLDGQSRRQIAPFMDQLVAVAEPGAIVVSAGTAAFLRQHFMLAPTASSVGGLAVYNVIGHDALSLGQLESGTRFVGRRHELALLDSRLKSVLAGRGQLVAIVGDAGIGKSRLVWELMRTDASSMRQLVTGSAYAEMTPYLPVIELLRRHFGIERDDAVERVRERVVALVSSRDGSLKPALPALLALLGVPDPHWDALEPFERRHQTLDAVEQLLVVESRLRPLLMVFEDIHWADPESQAVLDALVAVLPAAPILLLITYRTEKRHSWSNLPYYTQVNLAPLPPESADHLLTDLLGSDPSLDPVKHQLIDWTNGHPLFLEEWVQTLIETGALEGGRGAYRATRMASAGEVPATVEEILATRIERLGPEDKTLIQSAAAIGAEVPAALLFAVVDLSYDTLRSGMRRLQAAELLYDKTTDLGRGFAFKHVLTRDVAYRSLHPQARRELHRKILAVVEAMPSAGAPEVIGRLARHAVEGELWRKAVDYLRQAGDRAMGSAAPHEAAEYFGDALEALTHLPATRETLLEVVDLRVRMQDALWPPLRFDDLIENLRAAEVVAKELKDQRWQGWIACYLCRYFWAVGDLAAAGRAGEQALAIARGIHNLALLAETNVYRGIVQYAAGEYRKAVATLSETMSNLEAAVSLASADFPSRRFARNGPVILRSFLVRALSQLGDFANAIAEGETAMRAAEATRNPFELVAASTGLGAVYLLKDDLEKAIDVLEPGLRLCRDYGVLQWFSAVGASLGAAYVRSGRIEAGLRLLEESVEHNDRLRQVAHASVWEIFLGQAYLAAGRHGEATSVALRALAHCRTRGESGPEAWALHLLAAIEAGSAVPDEDLVRSRYEEAMARAAELGMRPLVAHCQFGLGTYHARRGDHIAAETCFGRAADGFRALGMPWSVR